MTAPEVTLPMPVPCATAALLARSGDLVANGTAVVIATVLTRRGSAPATPGQKLLLAGDGTCAGTIGGGALERSVLEEMLALLDAMARGTLPREGEGAGPRTVSLNLGAGLGMCCGGGVEVLLEPIEPGVPLLIVGAGHVARATVPLLTTLGFGVTVCDEREEWAEPTRLPGARVIAGSFRDAGRAIARHGAVLVMTHDHALDQEAIEWALRERFAWVGGVGSRAKMARTRARLEAKGFAAEAIARVRMPIGVAVGARSPDEIAVAIAAEMIAWRRGIVLETTERGARAVRVEPARTAQPRKND